MWFQSTHSLRSATYPSGEVETIMEVSIHALLAECDSYPLPARWKQSWKFQSTHSLRSATLVSFGIVNVPHGFNPRTPCGVRLYPSGEVETIMEVSIHALLAECDNDGETLTWAIYVSIHALLAECDMTRTTWQRFYGRFQSTHSLRSATRRWREFSSSWQFQSTHSLRSATPIA